MRDAFWWAVSGAVGAAVVAFNDRKLRPISLGIALFTGAAIAGYGVPLAAHFLKIDSLPVMVGIGFALGVAAKPIVKRVATDPFELFRPKAKKDG
ncbi:MAG: hypothetical protein AAF478_03435 [Pseudomonadota bacterium]